MYLFQDENNFGASARPEIGVKTSYCEIWRLFAAYAFNISNHFHSTDERYFLEFK